MRTTALDWNRRELRFVTVENSRRRRLRVLESGCISFEGDASHSEQLSLAIDQALSGRKTNVVVPLGAGAVEMTRFTVPTASDSELPLFVHNLARSEMGIVAEQPALEFVAEPPGEDGSRTATAMLLREDDLTRLREQLGHHAASLMHLPLRPHGLAEYLATRGGLRIATSVARGICDVLVLEDDRPLAVRSLRLPIGADPVQLSRHCVNEISRTLVGVCDEPETNPPVEIVVLGDGRVAGEVATGLTAEFGTNASLKDPFGDVDCDQSPEDSGAYAGLLGVLQPCRSPKIDFLNPRRPAQPAGKTKPVLMALAAVLALVGGGAWYVWSQFEEIDVENRRLEARVRELNKLVKESQPKRSLARALASWEAARFSWLDELRDITERMPSRSELTIRQLSISPARGGSTVTFSGVATQADAVAKMEASLRDEYHALRTPGLRDQSSGDDATWTFQTTMRVKPRTKRQYVSAKTSRADVADRQPEAAR